MSINRETEEAASLQIGPTSEGMVRLYIEGERFNLPMDFEPEEAEEIAQELLAAAQRARGKQANGSKGSKDGKGAKKKGKG
ncbi:MAG: DUF6324 family protein [Pseudomonadota bacterium]